MLSARLRPITAIPTTPICCLDITYSCQVWSPRKRRGLNVSIMLTQISRNCVVKLCLKGFSALTFFMYQYRSSYCLVTLIQVYRWSAICFNLFAQISSSAVWSICDRCSNKLTSSLEFLK